MLLLIALAACGNTEVDDEAPRQTDWGEVVAVESAAPPAFEARPEEVREPLVERVYPHEDLPRLGIEPITSITGEEVSYSELPIPSDETLPDRSEFEELPRYYVMAIEREARLWRVLRAFLGAEVWQRPGAYARMRAHGLEVSVPEAVHERVAALFKALREEEQQEHLVDMDVRMLLVEPEALRPFATAFPLARAQTQGVHVVTRQRDAARWVEQVLDEDGAREIVTTRLTMRPGLAESSRLVSQRRFVRYHEPRAASHEQSVPRRYQGEGPSQPAMDTDERGFVFEARSLPDSSGNRVTLSLQMELSPRVPFRELPFGDGERRVHLPVGSVVRQQLSATIPLEHTFVHVLPNALIAMEEGEEGSSEPRRQGALLLLVTPRLIDRTTALE